LQTSAKTPSNTPTMKHQTQPPRECPHFVSLPSIMKIEKQITCMTIYCQKRRKNKSKHVLIVGNFLQQKGF
jgi:hypothetical protein